MAERRMLSKKIINDDKFIKLPASTQALYLHLIMSADDDGFSGQVETSMFRAHARTSDLRKLIDKGYIYQFDSEVIVIVHWLMENAIRKDRYTSTMFQEEFSQLRLKADKSYIWASDGCHMEDNCLPQDSSGEDRTVKERYNNDTDSNQQMLNQQPEIHRNEDICPFFEDLWAIYPNQKGKNKITKDSLNKMKEIGYDAMLNAVKAYKEEVADTDIRYIKYGSTFFNGDFEEYIGRKLQAEDDAVLQNINKVPAFNVPELEIKT